MKKTVIFLFSLLLCVSACKESDGTDFDSGQWRSYNETYFEEMYQAHKAASTADCFVLSKWSLAEERDGITPASTDCILVDVLQHGDEGGNMPEYTDSVMIHYSGHLLPSDDYPSGYEFDRSYLTTFDPVMDVPSRFYVGNLVPGMSTALQHMRRGDHWIVTVPYQLGYGTTDRTNIPAYSTLFFEVYLVDFWQKDEGDRYQ